MPKTRPSLPFWFLLAISTAFLVLPIWIGPIPPMPDFGGHVANADIWANLDSVELYAQMFERRAGIVPNTLSARFVSWLHPLIPTITGLRLYVTLMLLGTVGALIGTAHTFDRSPWVVFLALPFLWNTGLHWGMVNFVAFFPFFFATLIFARKAGADGHWTWSVGLVVATVLSFFAHGIGPPFTVGTATFVLFCSASSPTHLIHLLSFLPSVALWFYWKAGAQGQFGVPGQSLWDMLMHHSDWRPPQEKLKFLVEHAFNATSSQVEVYIFAGLVGIFILWMGVSDTAPKPSDDRSESESSAWWHTVMGILRRHTLLWTVGCLWLAFWLLPSSYGYTNVATRVGAIFVMTAALLPRPDSEDVLTYLFAGVCALTSIGFGIFVADAVNEFQHRHLAPIEKLSAHIEPQSRVECFGLPGYMNSIIHATPLDHNCTGLIQARTSSFGGYIFPRNPFNPVGFKEGHGYEPLDNHGVDDLGQLQSWDYLLTDGAHPAPPKELTELVATATGAGGDSPTWHLYRVKQFGRSWTSQLRTPGGGGSAFAWNCPGGYVQAGFEGAQTHGGSVSYLRPICHPTPEGPMETPLTLRSSGMGPQTLEGPRIGHITRVDRRFQTVCPRDEVMVGIEAIQKELLRDIAVRCATPTLTGGAETDGPRYRWQPLESTVVGRVSGRGNVFSLACPSDSLVTGTLGRHGRNIDAIGIGCEPIAF